MRSRNLVLFVALVTLICMFSSAAHVTAAPKTVDLENHVRSLNFSKTVPGQLNYQGYLVDAADSSAVTATLEMTFRLYDSETNGTELWSETHPAVEVSNGLFYVLLGSVTPFPGGLFDGSTLYLQMEVGTDVFSPRKSLVSVPYSQRSNSAEMLLDNTLTDLDDRWVNEADLDHLDAADGDPAAVVYVDSAGQVGIGTTSPAQKLDVAGTVQLTGFQMPTGAIDNYVLTSDSSGVGSWQPAAAAPDADWTIVGNDMYSAVSGNVGIGTTSPVTKLEVVGEAIFDGFLYARDATGIGLTDALVNSGVWVEDGGQVGIGTQTPDHDLDVDGTAGFRNYLYHKDDTDTYLYFTVDQIDLYAGGVQMMTASKAKGTAVVINENSADVDFRVESVNDANALFVRGSDGKVGVGTAEPDAKLHVEGSTGNFAWLGGNFLSVYGKHSTSANNGYIGGGGYGAYGEHHSTGNYGVLGDSTSGVFGGYGPPGDIGDLGSPRAGGHGVYGKHNPSGNYGYLGDSNYGVYGIQDSSGNYGYLGDSNCGAYGMDHSSGNYGYLGDSNYGVYGKNFTSRTFGYLDGDSCGVYGSGSPYGGYFIGNVEIEGNAEVDGNLHITGTLSKGGGSFLIDHPLDPTNKLLRHNFVESPENLLIYRGKTRLDANGEAVVEMPDYFQALTKEDEASIHLTPVGRPFLTGAEWISGFRSLTVYGEPDREVFWEMLADRDDPVIRQLARPVVEDKGSDSELCDRGELLYPTAYGYPESMGRDYKVREREEMHQPEPVGDLSISEGRQEAGVR